MRWAGAIGIHNRANNMKKAIKWIMVLALLGGGGYWFYDAKVKTKKAAKPSYDGAKVELRDLRTTVESTGEVQPRNRLDVKPPIAGRLEELLVDEGEIQRELKDSDSRTSIEVTTR